MPTSRAASGATAGMRQKDKPAERVPPLSRSRDLLPSRHRRAARHRASRFMASELRFNMLRRGSVARASEPALDRKSTRLNSSHDQISYAVFCLKKKKKI